MFSGGSIVPKITVFMPLWAASLINALSSGARRIVRVRLLSLSAVLMSSEIVAVTVSLWILGVTLNLGGVFLARVACRMCSRVVASWNGSRIGVVPCWSYCEVLMCTGRVWHVRVCTFTGV